MQSLSVYRMHYLSGIEILNIINNLISQNIQDKLDTDFDINHRSFDSNTLH